MHCRMWERRPATLLAGKPSAGGQASPVRQAPLCGANTPSGRSATW